MWIGEKLGAVERACLRSVVGQGHRLTLYCYDRPDGVPDGVAVADAGAVLSRDQVVRYRSGSYSLFSNHFRYETQRKGLGTWLDCDAYLLKPLDGARDYLIGESEPGRYATGVLRLPADAPHLQSLIEPFEEKRVPHWLGWRSRLAARIRKAVTGRTGVADMPWGTTGPHALTAVVHAHGVDVDPLPSEVLYPVPWQDAHWIADPARTLEDMVTPRTVSLHLYNERIKAIKARPAPAGSFLARLQHEGR